MLTNRESPDKRPKAEEEEGRSVIIDRLDQPYAAFENRVVEGRSRRVLDKKLGLDFPFI